MTFLPIPIGTDRPQRRFPWMNVLLIATKIFQWVAAFADNLTLGGIPTAFADNRLNGVLFIGSILAGTYIGLQFSGILSASPNQLLFLGSIFTSPHGYKGSSRAHGRKTIKRLISQGSFRQKRRFKAILRQSRKACPSQGRPRSCRADGIRKPSSRTSRIGRAPGRSRDS